MPRVCTSQPAKVELQGPWLAVLASTTAGSRERRLAQLLSAPWALASLTPQLTALGQGRHPQPLGSGQPHPKAHSSGTGPPSPAPGPLACLWCRVTASDTIGSRLQSCPGHRCASPSPQGPPPTPLPRWYSSLPL